MTYHSSFVSSETENMTTLRVKYNNYILSISIIVFNNKSIDIIDIF
ncbi:hypothetical protein HMPREF9089_00704 [Eubacterium brachy ATCC 33089]|nr:hypothetical protein HMPREF9089_00704 [Eubacterium brachy ATCC 33089]